MPFRVVETGAEERLEGLSPEELAELNALGKALGAVLPERLASGAFVLGADTLVVVDEAVLGKPADREAAAGMLDLLNGRAHRVVSGVALRRLDESGREVARAVGHAVTTVRVRGFSHVERTAYLDSGEWDGKAGGYAIQGLAALLVEGIDGDYTNVVGLPLPLLGRLFAKAGFDLLQGVWLAPDGSPEALGPPLGGGRADVPRAGIIPGLGLMRQEE